MSRPLTRVVPISIFRGSRQLNHVLREYKNSPSQGTRDRLRLRLAAIIARFLRHHAGCLSSDGWDVITPVPSSQNRPGTHPLRLALDAIPRYREQLADLLGPGQDDIRHRTASDRGYAVNTTVRDLRILLVDDMFTSGARLQSAASALTLAGANVIAGLVVGRKYFDDDRHTAVYTHARRTQFSFEVCCLEEEPWPFNDGS